jgi:hypothetical protein
VVRSPVARDPAGHELRDFEDAIVDVIDRTVNTQGGDFDPERDIASIMGDHDREAARSGAAGLPPPQGGVHDRVHP